VNKSEDNPDMRVLRTSSCKSITGKSTLQYQLAVTPDNSVHIRITKNTGAGQFSPEWIRIADIQKSLAKGHKGSPLTSFLLQPLFKGKSANTPAFIMAALTQEKLLRVLKGKKRGHELLDPEGFNVKMDKLAASKSKPKVMTSTRKKAIVKKAPTKKVAIKKKASVEVRFRPPRNGADRKTFTILHLCDP